MGHNFAFQETYRHGKTRDPRDPGSRKICEDCGNLPPFSTKDNNFDKNMFVFVLIIKIGSQFCCF